MNVFQQNNVETRLCKAVDTAIQSQDGDLLKTIVIIEPEYPADHQELIQSLRSNYPESNSNSTQRLEQLIKRTVSQTAESSDANGRPIQSWSSMVTFLVEWMAFLRDVEPTNLLQVYKRLSDLLQ